MLVFSIIICLLFVLIFFHIPADECNPTTSSARPRPATRPPATPAVHDTVPTTADARAHHATSPSRPLPARASALTLPPAPARAPTKSNDDGSAGPQDDGTKWNPALRDGPRLDPLPQYRSETANAARISQLYTEWASSESLPWTSSNVPTITRR